MVPISQICALTWKLVELTDVLKNTEFGVFKNAEVVKAIRVEGGANRAARK